MENMGNMGNLFAKLGSANSHWYAKREYVRSEFIEERESEILHILQIPIPLTASDYE
tara:strand:+ start:181 stop:351 length:171 start_codon:yes stop_codon:yes gene_type:complete